MRSILAFALLAAIPAPGLAQVPPVPAQPRPAVDYGVAIPVTGAWRFAPVPGGSSAVFAANPAAPLLTLTCNRLYRRVSISRPATGAAPFLYVWTSTASRNLPASFNPTTRLIAAELSAYDKLLDALAFSRGRIVVGPSTGGTLVAPMWPEIIRVVEDCRS